VQTFVNCKDIDHANVVFVTVPRATYMVLAGHVVPAGTTLVNPALESSNAFEKCLDF